MCNTEMIDLLNLYNTNILSCEEISILFQKYGNDGWFISPKSDTEIRINRKCQYCGIWERNKNKNFCDGCGALLP